MDCAEKQIAVELQRLSLGFPGRELLTDVSARFRMGQLVALIGRNGSGKSTLMREIAGIGHRHSGVIKLSGIDNPSSQERARIVSFVGTRRVRVQSMRVRELVGLGRSPMTNWVGRLTDDDRRAIDRAMTLTGIVAFADRPLDSLSDGEAQRAMIARAVAQDTPLILLDEPTSFLDLPGRVELCRMLQDLTSQGKCVIFTTHELELAKQFADLIALIDIPDLVTGLPTEMAEMINRKFGLERLANR